MRDRYPVGVQGFELPFALQQLQPTQGICRRLEADGRARRQRQAVERQVGAFHALVCEQSLPSDAGCARFSLHALFVERGRHCGSESRPITITEALFPGRILRMGARIAARSIRMAAHLRTTAGGLVSSSPESSPSTVSKSLASRKLR